MFIQPFILRHHKNSVGLFPDQSLLPSVRTFRLPHPVFITPPANAGGHWAVKSETQNRPQRVKVILGTNTGAVLKRENFEDRHFLDRIIGIGVAAYEGQLFGWPISRWDWRPSGVSSCW